MKVTSTRIKLNFQTSITSQLEGINIPFSLLFSQVQGGSHCQSLVCELALQYCSSTSLATGKKYNKNQNVSKKTKDIKVH